MDELIRIAALVAATTASGGGAPALHTEPSFAVARWPGADKFRHAGMSWATTVFSYAAVRAAQQDHDTALMVALPLTAAIGVGKEIADHRRGGAFSMRDLVADAAGAGVAWLLLREVR